MKKSKKIMAFTLAMTMAFGSLALTGCGEEKSSSNSSAESISSSADTQSETQAEASAADDKSSSESKETSSTEESSEDTNDSSAAEMSKEDKLKKLEELASTRRDPFTCIFECGDDEYLASHKNSQTYNDALFNILMIFEGKMSANKFSETKLSTKEDFVKTFNNYSKEYQAEIIENCDFYDAMINFLDSDTPYPIIMENYSDSTLLVVDSCSYNMKKIIACNDTTLAAFKFEKYEQGTYSVIKFTKK